MNICYKSLGIGMALGAGGLCSGYLLSAFLHPSVSQSCRTNGEFVQTLDLNGDGRPDYVIADAHRSIYCVSNSDGTYSRGFLQTDLDGSFFVQMDDGRKGYFRATSGLQDSNGDEGAFRTRSVQPASAEQSLELAV